MAAADQTQTLWQEYRKSNDQELRDRLILTYAPLVKFVAGRVGASLPAHVDQQDLVSYGLLGLIGAIERFDPSREIKFETFAMARIRGAIIDELRRSTGCLAPSGRGLARSSVRSRRSRKSPSRSDRRGDREKARCDRGGARRQPPRDLALFRRRARRVSSPAGGGDSIALIDTIEDDWVRPEMSLEQTEVREALAEAISELPEREKLVVTLDDYEELTLREIGEVLGVTESRVSQPTRRRSCASRRISPAPRARPPRHREGPLEAGLLGTEEAVGLVDQPLPTGWK